MMHKILRFYLTSCTTFFPIFIIFLFVLVEAILLGIPVLNQEIYQRFHLFFMGIGLFSIALLVIQLITINKALRCSVINDETQPLFKIGEIFIKEPELRKYFYEGIQIPKNMDIKDAKKLEAIAIYFLDYFDYLFLMMDSSIKTLEESDRNFKQWMKDMFKKSPILRDTYKSQQNWWDKRIKEIFEEAEKEL